MLVATILTLLSGLGLAFDFDPSKFNYTTCETGNPFITNVFGYADSVTYGDTFWIYHANYPGNENNLVIDAYYSTDLLQWKSHLMVLNLSDFSGARGYIASVSAITMNNHYYLYFSTTTNTPSYGHVNESTAIFVGIADNPQGPYRDARDTVPIWSSDRDTNRDPTTSPSVFVDRDGKAYLFYTSGTLAKALHLQEDMINTVPRSLIDVTPVNVSATALVSLSESSKVFQHGNWYYMIWKGEGEMGISYAVSDAPTGRFNASAKILERNPALATTLGHGTVLIVPGTNISYMIYSRNLTLDDGTGVGGLAYDRMYIDEHDDANAPATIRPVKMAVIDGFDYSDMHPVWKQGYGNMSLRGWEDSDPSDNPNNCFISLETETGGLPCAPTLVP